MRISDSHLQLSAHHSALEYQRQKASLTAWQDTPDGRRQVHVDTETTQLRASVDGVHLDQRMRTVDVAAQQPSSLSPPPASPPPAASDASPPTDAPPAAEATAQDLQDVQLTVLRLMLERLTGHSVHVFDSRTLRADPADMPALPASPSQASHDPRGDRVGWGMSLQVEDTRIEQESTQFVAQGIVRTADGQEIRLNVVLNMQRQMVSNSRLSLRAGDALKDPLVINFQGTAAQLTQTTFEFDLDADGHADALHALASGSAYIALDKNGNGRIDDGSELFGTRTGDGFAELAQYDDDHNGWIDDNDAVFRQLLAWRGDSTTTGSPTAPTLSELGIGALYLGRIGTPFMLKDASGTTTGAIRASGLYLNSDGRIGTLQQIDVTV
jgi:hypothetical protein